MAKVRKKPTGAPRKGRRTLPAVRRSSARMSLRTRAPLTLGDFIAAAYDSLGADPRRVARVLASRAMAEVTGLRVVVT